MLSAAYDDETAHPYKEMGHGLFTYFLLKKLKETKGNVTLEELSEYIKTNVTRQSVLELKKSQTPTVIPSQKVSEEWKNWKLMGN